MLVVYEVFIRGSDDNFILFFVKVFVVSYDGLDDYRYLLYIGVLILFYLFVFNRLLGN